MSSTLYDVVILPNADIAEKTINASESLKNLDCYFTLQKGKYFPHISLYMLQIKETDLDKARAMLSQIAADTNRLSLQTASYRQSFGYIEVGYQKNDQLTDLQQQIVKSFNDLRDGLPKVDEDRMHSATGLALANFQNYGYKYVGELFRPHITLTRFKEEQPQAEKLLPNLSVFSGEFSKIGFFEVDGNAACVKEISSFELL